jgi:hypothetical protein
MNPFGIVDVNGMVNFIHQGNGKKWVRNGDMGNKSNI